MSNSRLATALFAGHILVASVAWTMGFLAGRLCQRRIDGHDEFDRFIHHLEAYDRRPYNWDIDGECLARSLPGERGSSRPSPSSGRAQRGVR